MDEPIVVRGVGITLDLLLWRRTGVRGQSLVAQALDLNPGLADLGVEIPLGTRVVLPALPPEERNAPRKIISLFG